MLNVVLQIQVDFDENTDLGMIIDVCHSALKSMIEIVKCNDDDNTILFAADSLCSICASISRWNIRQLIFLSIDIESIFITNISVWQVLRHARFEGKESDRA